VRTEDDLRTALTELERHAPAAARVLPGSSRSRRGLRSPLAARWLAGITTAAALAGLVAALTLPAGTARTIPNGGVSSPSGTGKDTTLKAKLLAAFSAASGEIAYTRTTSTSGGRGVIQENWYYPWQAAAGQQVRNRQSILSLDGALAFDQEDVYTMPASGQEVVKGQVIDVNYGTKTWSDQKNQPIGDFDQADPDRLLAAIKSGGWKEVGPTTLNGHRAIKLHLHDLGADWYVWVDASTYLPLRQTFIWPTPPHGVIATIITDYQLKPATSGNLAKLTPPVPAGFRKTAKPAE
jgi:hypothetical protein